MQSRAEQARTLERLQNFLMAQLGEVTGFPQPVPFPETPIVNDFGNKVYHNIRVSNSTIGAINTGSIQSLDIAISTLQEQGAVKVADALRSLSQAIVDSSELSDEKREEALELLDAVSAELAAPAAQRRKSLARPLMAGLADVVRGALALEPVVSKYLPVIVSYFGG